MRLKLLILLFLVFTCSVLHAEIYKYKTEDGVWHFVDRPAPGEFENGKDSPAKNAKEPLFSEVEGQNQIEEATRAVVTIYSSTGFGSGFFVSDNGYVLTNRHVLRGNKEITEKRKEKFAEYSHKLEEQEEKFRKWKEDIRNYKEDIHGFRRRMQKVSDPERKEELQDRYEKYLQKHKSMRDKYRENYRRFKKDKREFDAKESRFHFSVSNSALKRNFRIKTKDGREFYAHLISESKNPDLALIKLDGYKTPYLRPAPEIKQGMTVYAVGSPLGLRDSVSKGIVSGWEKGYIQTDAHIYPGNSGGALITSNGRVAGINTFKKLTRKFEGLGFAIPIDRAFAEFSRFLR